MEKTVFWNLDDRYLGSTRTFHQMPVIPERGSHRLVLVDEDGERLEREFQVLGDPDP